MRRRVASYAPLKKKKDYALRRTHRAWKKFPAATTRFSGRRVERKKPPNTLGIIRLGMRRANP
jgi:hypothetical protein